VLLYGVGSIAEAVFGEKLIVGVAIDDQHVSRRRLQPGKQTCRLAVENQAAQVCICWKQEFLIL
jgi:hypothetical protein